MYGKRRRKNRGTWFPTLPTTPDTGALFELTKSATLLGSLDLPTDGSPIIGVFPLTYDYPEEGTADVDQNESHLTDFIGQEYIVKRIVGNFLGYFETAFDTGANPTGNPVACLLTAGFMVARSDYTGAAGGEANEPIGWNAGSTESILSSYGPDHPDTVRQPWMWKRQWILGNRLYQNWAEAYSSAGNIVAQQESCFPPTTAGYASLRDGPNIDIKSRRRVRKDERLWLVASARALPFATPFTKASSAVFYMNYRIFGNLVKARARSAF